MQKLFRNLCPRNCFSTCSILSYVEKGKLVRVSGDPAHGFTRGKLCAKGYAYVERVYSPKRILYPLRQFPRGSGNWRRISWDEALQIIASKMLELKGRYDSFLPVCLCKHYGNMGLLHYAPEALFDGLGSITVTEGSACWSAGLDAYLYCTGTVEKSDPEDMVNSKVIILWGVNPAWTAVHQMYFIDQARNRGAQVVVIDPIFTATAIQADLYLQPKAGSDGALALGIAKYIVDNALYDEKFLVHHVYGYKAFFEYLKTISYDWVEDRTALPKEAIWEVAELYAKNSPAALWTGFGLQRHTNGGQNIRAIITLAALTGNLGKSGAGVYYASMKHWELFSFYTRDYISSKNPVLHRKVNINTLGKELEKIANPPVKMLWLTQRNLFQDAETASLKSALEDLELIVQVDQFMNQSSRYADIFCRQPLNLKNGMLYQAIGITG
ncbi:molybdopterin-dependent oxidoreductase [Carboxydothermus pertinax]|uniref:molybdopterin-dependent oxidoreductase n=1 Tax=Carboxydothermus pertinax TaxID=870242 RepID=UPI000A43B3A4|nr:molybdopterin-dependent oxidoreductase [Carboxydothermus pertinax]